MLATVEVGDSTTQAESTVEVSVRDLKFYYGQSEALHLHTNATKYRAII